MSKQTALLGIMDESTFKARTKATHAVGGFFSKFKSRGGGMAAIDLALEAWSRDCDKGNVAASVKQAHVAAIAAACDQWFKQKTQAGKSTDLSEARGQVIAEVRRSCIKAHQYLKNKSSAEASTPAGLSAKRGGVKALGAGYAHERTAYVASNKQQNPFSASAVDELTHSIGTSSFAQFSQTATSSGVDRVEFLNREQRLAHLVVIQNGLLYQNGDLMHQDYFPQYTEPTIYADTYAVDRYGNIYSKKIKIGAVRFNHSSYCAGKAVLCAGTIACQDGKPIYISNMSGHYKPNTAYVAQFLRVLNEEGVDLSNTLVESMDTKRAVKAMSLLQSAAAPQDWPHWNGPMPRVMVKGKLTVIENPM